MTESDAAAGSGVQVDRSHYSTAKYCSPGRFASYAYQIREILDSGTRSVLEIGPGNGVVTYVLRQAGVCVDTVDHDPSLEPDVVASVLELPFPADSYAAVLCCQILEHIPWDRFRETMLRISSIARQRIVLSLPHRSAHQYFIEYKLPRLKQRRISIDLNPRKPFPEFRGQHHWEIGKGVTEKDVMQAFKDLHLAIDASYRIPEDRYFHFFCLSKQKQPPGAPNRS